MKMLLTALLLTAPAFAQSYPLTWHVDSVAGGYVKVTGDGVQYTARCYDYCGVPAILVGLDVSGRSPAKGSEPYAFIVMDHKHPAIIVFLRGSEKGPRFPIVGAVQRGKK